MATSMKAFKEMRDDHANDELVAKQWLEQRLMKCKAQGIISEVVKLTPPLAREFLRHNSENRTIRPAKLKQYVEDIDQNRWELNGAPIIFSNAGAMNDGQHRCEAVIQTQKPIDVVVLFGVTRESRRTVDIGASRSPGDLLGVEGVVYAKESASIARFILAYERGKKKRLSEANRITATEVVDFALTDKRLPEAAMFGKGGGNFAKKRAIIAPASVLGFCYYIFDKKDPKGAGQFLRSVITGVNLAADDPAYVVRERLQSLDRPLREHRIHLLFQAFNAFREKRTLVLTNPKSSDLPKLV